MSQNYQESNDTSHKFTKIHKSNYESLDYTDNIVDKASIHNSVREFISVMLIGMIVGAIGFIIDTAVDYFTTQKFKSVTFFMNGGKDTESLLLMFGVCILCALVATSLVIFVAPAAAGSGIPEIKSYLNGTNIQKFLKIQTGITKIIGIIFAVSAGFLIGKEGPMIHIGAIMGAYIATLPGLPHNDFVMAYRTDKAKRDFVAIGGAAGVAAAFGSPLGGVLFAIEEASTYWNALLTAKTFLAAMMSTGTLWLLSSWYKVSDNFFWLSTFGNFANEPLMSNRMIPVLILMAIVCGLVGAAFCQLQLKLSIWRKRYASTCRSVGMYKISEVILIAILTTAVVVSLPSIPGLSGCVPTRANMFCDAKQNKYYCGYHGTKAYNGNDYVGSLISSDKCSADYSCKDNSFYGDYKCANGTFNTSASIWFSNYNKAIKGLFHNTAPYDLYALGISFILAFILSIITYGIAIPSGLFIPAILMGGLLGRFIGELMVIYFPNNQTSAGIYAVFGAAGMVSGITRLTVTIALILYETTGMTYMCVHIMIVVIISKIVGDIFNISIYDMHIELKDISFIEIEHHKLLHDLKVKDIMTDKVIVMKEVEFIDEVIKKIRGNTHNGFPVVKMVNGKWIYKGMITRNHIIIMIKHNAFFCSDDIKKLSWDINANYHEHGDVQLSHTLKTSQHLRYEDFGKSLQSRVEGLDDYDKYFGDTYKEIVMDFREYCTNFIQVQEDCPASYGHSLFRNLQLRHLPVVNETMEVVGIVTRRDVVHYHDLDPKVDINRKIDIDADILDDNLIEKKDNEYKMDQIYGNNKISDDLEVIEDKYKE